MASSRKTRKLGRKIGRKIGRKLERQQGGIRRTKGNPSKGKARKPQTTLADAPGPNQCFPRRGHVYDGVCLPLDVLEKVSGKLGLAAASASQTKRALFSQIAKALGVDAMKQRSVLEAMPLPAAEKTALAAEWLRPAQPAAWVSDPDMWLDTVNIRDVMMQYEKGRDDFTFLGPYPIDFAAAEDSGPGRAGTSDRCLIGEMCGLDLKTSKDYIGIIYNLDPHYKSGSHWVANFINRPAKTCYYFDSYGMRPPHRVYRFMQWLTIQMPGMELGWNGRKFQFSDSECGMYSMYFIDRMLAGEPFLKFCRRAPPDKFMLDMRDWFYST